MKLLFPEEHEVTSRLSDEWREVVAALFQRSLVTVDQKGRGRDGTSVVWHRAPFPDGMLTVIDQKTERMQALLAKFNPHDTIDDIRWDKVIEEAMDVGTYWIFFAAIAEMLRRRRDDG